MGRRVEQVTKRTSMLDNGGASSLLDPGWMVLKGRGVVSFQANLRCGFFCSPSFSQILETGELLHGYV